jgi:hypothetical protein
MQPLNSKLQATVPRRARPWVQHPGKIQDCFSAKFELALCYFSLQSRRTVYSGQNLLQKTIDYSQN